VKEIFVRLLTSGGPLSILSVVPHLHGEEIETEKRNIMPATIVSTSQHEQTETGKAMTAYEAALAAVPDGKKTVLPGVQPSPSRKVAGTKKLPHPARVKDAARKGKPVGPVQATADKITQESKAKTAAIKAGKLTKGEKAATKGRIDRLTVEWLSFKGKNIVVKDHVKTPDGITIEVIGRWTKKGKDGNVPMVTGHIVALPTSATVAAGDTAKSDTKGRHKGDRLNAVAAEASHAKK
jgi:hypothetical protein